MQRTTSSLRVITPQNTHSQLHTRTVTHALAGSRETLEAGNKTFLVPVIFRLWCVQSPSDKTTPGSSQVSPPDCQAAHGGDVGPPPRSSSWVSRSSTLPCAWVYRVCDVIRFVSFSFSFFFFIHNLLRASRAD